MFIKTLPLNNITFILQFTYKLEFFKVHGHTNKGESGVKLYLESREECVYCLLELWVHDVMAELLIHEDTQTADGNAPDRTEPNIQWHTHNTTEKVELTMQ